MSDFTILLVEDSPLMRRLVRGMLAAIGPFTIVEAAEGGEALTVLANRRVDLVLSDWVMEPVDGFHLLQAMRARAELAAIPFVMMTAEQTPATIAQAVASGISFYLAKPFGRDQLTKLMARIPGWQVQAA